MEGGDLMAGAVDVIVTDGFTGNVALKTLEGSMRFAAAELRAALTGTRAARVGALLQRRGLRELSARLDAETYGGAALLGLGGTVVIAHGASTARAVTAACALAANLSRGDITEKIKARIGPAAERRGAPTSCAATASGYRGRVARPAILIPRCPAGNTKLAPWQILSRFSARGCATPWWPRTARTTLTRTR